MALESVADITEMEFNLFTEYIKSNYGIIMGQDKQALLVGRLQNVIQQMNFSSFSEYFHYVLNDHSGDAVTTLVNKITTNHTYFMRETGHFNYFRDTVIPYLKKNISDRDLRIWSAGCSTGEEPYTLAMILDDELDKEKLLWNTKVLATDISTGALEKAKKGLYTSEQVEPLPNAWKLKHIKKINNFEFQFDTKIRSEVVFRRFNLMESVFPFKKKFHVIFCRNVMIYFDGRTKMELINKFYDVLEPGGYFFIGQSETVKREETRFKYIMPAVYRKE